MERKLIHYLPYAVRDFAEFKGIAVGEQPEFELAWSLVDGLLDNQFVYTAGAYGLSRWESMLEIVPKATDTLEERRFRILVRLGELLPYTMTWLRTTLKSLCGQENFSVFMEEGSYFLSVTVTDAVRKKSENAGTYCSRKYCLSGASFVAADLSERTCTDSFGRVD